MADPDVVTQLQTSLDQVCSICAMSLLVGTTDTSHQLATQFYASLRYITTHHPLSDPSPRAPPPNPHANSSTTGADAEDAPLPASPTHAPLAAGAFAADSRELASDLVAQQKIIESLIAKLPAGGVEEAERVQAARIEELAQELKELEEERAEARRAKEEMLQDVESRIVRVGMEEEVWPEVT